MCGIDRAQRFKHRVKRPITLYAPVLFYPQNPYLQQILFVLFCLPKKVPKKAPQSATPWLRMVPWLSFCATVVNSSRTLLIKTPILKNLICTAFKKCFTVLLWSLWFSKARLLPSGFLKSWRDFKVFRFVWSLRLLNVFLRACRSV